MKGINYSATGNTFLVVDSREERLDDETKHNIVVKNVDKNDGVPTFLPYLTDDRYDILHYESSTFSVAARFLYIDNSSLRLNTGANR